MININRLIVRAIAPWRTIRRLQKQVDRLENVFSNPFISGVELGVERGIEMGFYGSGPQLLAGMFFGFLEQNGSHAPNYLEMTFASPKGPITVTVMQPNGATPNDLRVKAEAEVRRLESEVLMLRGSSNA